ncbi:MAG: O-antigen ligase family protein [Snowella sp.]|nr:O-antigen ligase family protein [Snowella sp.]
MPKPNLSQDSSETGGRLFALLTACFYALFTLLPNSSSLVVSWPWVFIWQMALLTPMLWLLWQVWQQERLQGLGLGLDWVVAIAVLGLLVSTLGAEFPNQARWYAWAALGFVAALYALRYWLKNPQSGYELLVKQGYLNIAFILVSLGLWTTQTWLPQLALINTAKQQGVNLAFNFSTLELRNWAPLGHQNYVAGYLVLALPLLIALSLIESGKKRWLWIGATLLGLIDFYTTSSRGGWLGLVTFGLFALLGLWIQGQVPRRWLGFASLGIVGAIAVLFLSNNRLQSSLINLFQGQSTGELGYRLLNATLGWRMGSSQPLTGIGLGGVPILYQKYRPIWAGRDSEITYQLHSTPAQLFAEMGIWGIIIPLAFLIWLIYQLWQWVKRFKTKPSQTTESARDFIIIWGLVGAILGYGVTSITDYQLDNIAISGTLMIYTVVLLTLFRAWQSVSVTSPDQCSESPAIGSKVLTSPKTKTACCYGGLGLMIAMLIWLIPIQRAWQLSNQSFSALDAKKVPPFVQLLTQAHQITPWEAYYPNQLAWNLGNIGLLAPNETIKNQFTEESLKWFKTSLEVSPYQEFAHTNSGWLELSRNPQAASISFAKALQLVPAKRGVFYGLGLSLLAQQKTDLAIAAFSLECLRDPLFITSPFWRGPVLQPIYPLVLKEVETQLNELIKNASAKSSSLQATLHQIRGALYWWQGRLEEAQQDLQTYGNPTAQALLAISQGKSPLLDSLPQPTALVLQAWNQPDQREKLLERAWLEKTELPLPPKLKDQLIASMAQAEKLPAATFDQWIRNNSPFLQYRRQRLGFGVVSRHIDGPNPDDFFLVVENLPINTWFAEAFPSPFYDPEFDLMLQTLRDRVLQKVLQS